MTFCRAVGGGWSGDRGHLDALTFSTGTSSGMHMDTHVEIG